MPALDPVDQQVNPSPDRGVSCVLFPDELALARMLTLRAKDRARRHGPELCPAYASLFTKLEYRPEDAPHQVIRLQPGDLTRLTYVLLNALRQVE